MPESQPTDQQAPTPEETAPKGGMSISSMVD
jgi:UBX domain-containing protein 1/4